MIRKLREMAARKADSDTQPDGRAADQATASAEERQRPDLLDPDRVVTSDRDDMTVDEHRSRAQLLDKALHASCAYANQLWDELDAVRRYLVAALPPPPERPRGPIEPASPRSREDTAGWQAWEDAYTEVTALLAGPQGDLGHAREEARRLVRSRLEFSRAEQPTPETAVGPGER